MDFILDLISFLAIFVGLAIILSAAFFLFYFRKNSSSSYDSFLSGDVKKVAETLAKYSSWRITFQEFNSTLQAQLKLCSNRINELHKEESHLKDLITASNLLDDPNFERVKSLSNDLTVVKAKIKREVAWRKVLKTQYLFLLSKEKETDDNFFF